ncbi:PQQ-binding-like beta-propeller repeat protein [Streptomyces sp. NPDC020965]|uniref:outer membrane protein assembly factor BamB family protein n=1 Tax=Streptomyces sp. NPDC020965 TaxID=3365105 RepID=UPI0037B75A41
MTQPPPPENQPSENPPSENQPSENPPPRGPYPQDRPSPPPSGGFGAPQAPPPGGFGPPSGPFPPPQPGADQPVPGYGYPQQPPTQQGYGAGYPQQPGYGYPQNPGYGYPQQQPPPVQQGYGAGYPTQPMTGSAPAGSGGGRKRLSTQLRIVIAASVAVVLIIGGGVLFAATQDDGGDPDNKARSGPSAPADGSGASGDGTPADGPGLEKPPADVNARIAFQIPEPAHTDVTDVRGSWVTDKAYVKPGVRSIVAHDVAKGTPLWTLPLPGQICASSRHQSTDGKVAIVFEATRRTPPRNYQPCTEVGVVDLTTGKLLWRTSVTGATAGDGKVKFAEVTQSGTTVAAGGTGGGAAFDLDTGAVRWKPTVNADQCYDMGYAGGPALVAVRKCGSYDNARVSVQGLNPVSGAPLFSYTLPTSVAYASVVSTKPLLVAADVGDTAGTSGFSDLFSIDDKGALKAKIPATGDRYQAKCRTTEVERCTRITVGNGRVYLPTADHEGSAEYGDTNEIVSFDLATGKPTSDRADAGDRYTMFPIRMDGGNLIAYKRPPYDKGGQVISIDGGTFKQTVLMENPAEKPVREAETAYAMDSAEYRYVSGRLYVTTSMMSKPPYGKRNLAIVFTTAD